MAADGGGSARRVPARASHAVRYTLTRKALGTCHVTSEMHRASVDVELDGEPSYSNFSKSCPCGYRFLPGDFWRTERHTAWRGEVCKRCNRRNPIGFSVPDDTWSAVSRGRWNVLCPACFDEEAEAAGVAYWFGELTAMTWAGDDEDA